MVHIQSFKRNFLVIVLLLLISNNYFAGIIPYTNRISTNYGGSAVVIGGINATKNITADPLTSGQWDNTVINRITFGINLDYPGYVATSKRVKVKLKVKRWNVSNSPLSDTTVYLNVSYQPQMDTAVYKRLQRTQFYNAYKLDITIDSIYVNGTSTNTLPAN